MADDLNDDVNDTKEALTPESMQSFMKGVDALNGNISKLVSLAERPALAPVVAAPGDEDDEDDIAGPSLDDLEAMPRKDFAEFIVKRVLSTLDKEFAKPVVARLDKIEMTGEQRQLAVQVADLQAKHKDYWEYKDEMISLARENPGSSPENIYLLAKARNPAKSKELEAKYAPKDENGGVKTRKTFGGLQPKTGQRSEPSKRMGAEDALESAWDEVQRRHGDILSQFGD